MSGAGQPTPRPLDGTGLAVAVVAARWHEQVMAGLLDGARRALHDCRVSDVREVRVPGCFELPIAAQRVAAQPVDAVVALGVVIRGGTPHFTYVCRAVTDGLSRVALDTGVPVGFGVLTCDDDADALDRAGLAGSHEDKGYDAAHAAVDTALTLRAGGPVTALGSDRSPYAHGVEEQAVRPRVYRPLGARMVSAVAGVCLIAVFAFLWVMLPGQVRGQFSWFERITIIGCFALIVVPLYGIFRTRAVAGERGLAVTNGFHTREFSWAEVVAISLGSQRPWAVVDLADGSVVSVMALQNADGPRARRAAREIAGLITTHSHTDRDD